jgi:hypothetical protein
LDAILGEPIFKQALFPAPVVIESVELLLREKQYICRVRSRDGHEGISVSNSQQMEVLYPMFLKRFAPFFIGKDARDIEDLIPAATVNENNYKAQGLAIWVPLTTIEFAILDMFGNIDNTFLGGCKRILVSEHRRFSRPRMTVANAFHGGNRLRLSRFRIFRQRAPANSELVYLENTTPELSNASHDDSSAHPTKVQTAHRCSKTSQKLCWGETRVDDQATQAHDRRRCAETD